MKDKIISIVGKGVSILLGILAIAVVLALLIGYHFGIPYLFYKFINPDYSYAFHVACWFGFNHIMELWNRYKLNKQLKQYKEIHEILKGRL
ncbi:hypothetical protein PDQ75_25055 [Bacillus cereus group sp. Bc015]|uniref:hypothetical protein n=1 Tax=Bacillus cereus group sp. Bc015 TaxID=3018123 RepID=UPI0022DF4855|nr:hypothetical protein [Bacillus cereus group sp. Bc015]MDA2738426.1 hypothetical protein [Bacillus cereus group sp. Bc015]